MPDRFSRRKFLKASAIPTSAAPSHAVPDAASHNKVDLRQYSAGTIAHNAAIYPGKLQAALESRTLYIEVDLTIADGQLVVAHTPEDYLALPLDRKTLQNPQYVFKRIQKAGKVPFLDLKDEIVDISQMDEIREFIKGNTTMASSNNHETLRDLRKDGFEGKIFYSLGTESALATFLTENQKNNFSGRNSGVSIRHIFLAQNTVPTQLKDMGLTIAAWSPYTPFSIEQSLLNGAHIVTSDNFESLGKIQPVVS